MMHFKPLNHIHTANSILSLNMVVKECEPTTVIHSSIVLLQERFKQLHREKRRREEREVLRLFTDSPPCFNDTDHSTRHYIDYTKKRRRLFHTENLPTDLQPLKLSLSLWASSSTDCQTALWDVDAPVAKNKHTQDQLALCDLSSLMGSFETDVDTSLRL